MDKQIIEEDMVNAKDFCPHYSCQVDCYEARMCQWFVDTLQQLKAKEQECEELVSKGNQLDKKCKQQSWDIGNLGYKIKNQRHEINNRLKQLDQLKSDNDSLKSELMQTNCYLEADKETIDQLKAEVKSKTEYIQEQRDIINQYSKEIEMYKKCQGKRASKREEELKAENDELKQAYQRLNNMYNDNCNFTGKLEQTLTEIKEFVENEMTPNCDTNIILQKISEVIPDEN